MYAADSPGHSVSYPLYLNDLFDQAINDLGINRVRLEVNSGSENPVDYGAQYLNGDITEYEYIHVPGYAYQIVNDNADPNVIEPGGYHFTRMDRRVDELLLPMKQRVEANGEQLYVNLCVVDFGTSTLHSSSAEEYGEFILAVFQHMDSQYGFVPDGVEVELEPHHGTWDATELGNALVAAGNRLAANGYHPEFIAPSHTDMTGALNWFDSMVQIPGVLNYLTEFSYHRYAGVSDGTLQAIGNRAVQYGVKTGMLEWIGATYNELYKDLSMGRNSDWSQFTLLGTGADDGGNYFKLDESDPANPIVTPGQRTKFLRQYFKFIREGAVRIQANSDTPGVEPLAFINTNGGYVVAVKADSGSSFAIQGLPAGTYGIKYTTNGEYDIDLSDVTIGAGQTVNSNIPAQGVITVYAKATSNPTPTPTSPLPSPTPSGTPGTPSPSPTNTPEPSSTPIGYQPDIISLEPGTEYQTIGGWEATMYAADSPGHSVSYPLYLNDLFDQAINDLGINRVRLEVNSGSENPVDYGAQYLNGDITEYEYIHVPGYAYQIVNDNADPNVIEPGGYHFTRMDRRVDELLLPMKQRVEANGEQLYVNLCVVDFGTSTLHSSSAEEYGEFILAVFQHMDSQYGFVPDGVEVELEPHHGTWDATELGNALVAAGNRLAANGYHPEFIAPSHTDMTGALNWFDSMVQIPGVLNYLTEFSYHRYAGVSDGTLQAIGNRAVQYGVKTGMLEWIGATYNELYKDLSMGRNSDWSQFTLLGTGADDGGNYFKLDESDPANPIVTPGQRTKFLRQYFKFIREGAVRIQANSDTPGVEPLAFINTNGGYVVAVKADSGSSFAIQGLPAGTYGIKYTTNGEYDIDLPDVTIGAGQTVNSSIPVPGVITVYAKATANPTPTSPPPSPTPSGTPGPSGHRLFMPNLSFNNFQGN